MDARLIKRWLGGLDSLRMIDEASTSLARELVRQEGAALSMPRDPVEALATVASELAWNQLRHARHGQMVVRRISRAGVAGLEVIADDRGPGIADPTAALCESGPGNSSGSLGAGLSGSRRLADEMDLDVRWGEGTCVWARKFAAPVDRRREVAVLGRSCEEGPVSGDDGGFVRAYDGLLLGVADGLGHGEPAREAADRAIATLYEHPALPTGDIIETCDRALAGTRGAVMAAARLSEPGGALEVSCAGDTSTAVYGYRQAQRFPCASRVLGHAGQRPHRLPPKRAVLQRHDVLVMFTDGLLSRAQLSDDRALRAQHPLVIAHHLLRQFLRGYDDALVLVAR